MFRKLKSVSPIEVWLSNMEGRKLIAQAQCLLGINLHPNTKHQRARFIYFGISLLFGNLFIFTSFLEATEVFLQTNLAIVGVFSLTMTANCILLVKGRHSYDNCLDWCEQLHFQTDVTLHSCFKTCADESLQIVRRIRLILIIVFTAATSESFVRSILKQRFVPWFPIKLPLISETYLWNGVICYVINFSASLAMNLTNIIVFASIGMIVKHFIAVLEAMKVLLRQAETASDAEFKVIIRKVIELHCDLMQRVQIVIDVTNLQILWFEVSTYASLLYIWIVVFHQLSMIFIAGGGAFLFGLFVQLCWICGAYTNALEEFSVFLYDLKWYEMSPKKRKTLLQIMVTLHNPKVMMAGPFHSVAFENFKIMLQRVYSAGIGINNLMKR